VLLCIDWNCQTGKTDDDGIIARRTRSKLSLNDTPLDAIEASFVAPDITPDLYDEATLFGDDAEWQTFLAKLMKTEGTSCSLVWIFVSLFFQTLVGCWISKLLDKSSQLF